MKWFFSNFYFILFSWEGGYKGGGWIRKDWEISGIGVPDVTFPKIQYETIWHTGVKQSV